MGRGEQRDAGSEDTQKKSVPASGHVRYAQACGVAGGVKMPWPSA